MIYYRHYELEKLNSFRIKSTAEEIFFPQTDKEFIKLLDDKAIPIISNGTNIILREHIDKIICLRHMPKKIAKRGEDEYTVTANTNLSEFVSSVMKDGHGGCEGLYGIPGTVGGAIYMNASSADCISDYLVCAKVFNKKHGIKTLCRNEMHLSRRSSIFQKGESYILSARFNFEGTKFNRHEYKKNIVRRKLFPKNPNSGGIFKEWHKLIPFSKEIRRLGTDKIGISEKFINIIYNKGEASYSDILRYTNNVMAIASEKMVLEVVIL